MDQLQLFERAALDRGRTRAKGRRRNELLDVIELAMVVARRCLSDYSCPKSCHTFTQPQLLACLILKAYLKLTYRGTVELLDGSDGLRAAIGLSRVPAHTTLKEFAKRSLSPATLDHAVAEVFGMLVERGLVVREVAVDSTGIEADSASAHFVSRARRPRKGYVKLSLAVATTSMVLIAMTLSMGPTNDLTEARELLWKTASRTPADWYFMDRGYDAQWPHTLIAAAGATSFIPPVPRPTKNGPVIKTGPDRLRCARRTPYHYGRRWHVESFISGLKRTCGSTLGARSEPALLIEAALKALAYAIRR
ncbi:MAG: transposase [Tepidisphaeraceae bacterium]